MEYPGAVEVPAATAFRVKIVNLNNGVLGMVRQWQDMSLRRPPLALLHGIAAGFHQAGGSLWPRRDAHHRSERSEAEDGRGLRHEETVWCSSTSRSMRSEHVYPMQIRRRLHARHVAEQDGAYLIMRHIISLLLENEPGALSRVVGLFSQRNYNIESLTVAPTEDPTLSRLTLTTVGHDDVDRADHQEPQQADRGGQAGRPVGKCAHRARADAGQGQGHRRPARRDQAHRRHLSRPDRRRHAASVYTVQLAGTSDKLGQLHPGRSAPRRFWKRYAVVSPALPVATKY